MKFSFVVLLLLSMLVAILAKPSRPVRNTTPRSHSVRGPLKSHTGRPQPPHKADDNKTLVVPPGNIPKVEWKPKTGFRP
ncbi:hypothetical protein AAVH_17293 [Aphelenchoides avenae]|nr:hypothetical protein AAVH_17293 [Aphelenchus avenae]